MRLETISEMWRSFEAMVFAGVRDVPPVQRQEMKRAFMAGCWGMLQSMKTLGSAEFGEDAGAEQCQRWEDELRAFQAEVHRGRA